ncbi:MULTISPECIES: hypothetical protein [Psychrilyobacter]|uniref:Uncharacterized protein n=1 Tax=Psychrilyobacter piezotolerans TaxID=2293438 RepID=A0ABX9KGJ8_9FUSO|nr:MULTISPECIES: hypothetical protein [Psychrilyobacter]MCS5420342.1 hypothetical protein [Psychrilyobacter sp. S5]NDI78076.1 hypothetical protein [Psychrilyobacter piezotolerans]RDE61667.1 hypothetical protein DV867_08465 [Psychrilyobacter sp. S5]REI41059.1 hypothetical protein DYH56_08465 [Psychrilyobacter piezotolerans]
MKKKGSALILSILMLSFFMTITLTMYYIARNRNKRSIYKIKGMRISSGLDSGSAIAHYELYLADEYVSKGYLYETSGTPDYRGDNYPTTPPSITKRYTQEVVTSGGVITIVPKLGEHYTGVVLNNYNEYFAAYWDPTTGTAIQVSSGSTITSNDVLIQPWVAEDKIIDGKIASRAWMNNTGEKIVRLWTKTTGSAISVGGYRLTTVSGVYIDGSSIGAPLVPAKLDPTTSTSIELTYEKIVSIDKTTIGDSGTEDYRITYIEDAEATSSGSSIIIDKDELKSMTVEKLK